MNGAGDASPALALSQSSLERRIKLEEELFSGRQCRRAGRVDMDRGEGLSRGRGEERERAAFAQGQDPVGIKAHAARTVVGGTEHGATEQQGNRAQGTGHKQEKEEGKKAERRRRCGGAQSLTIDGPTGQTWQSRVGRQRARQGW